MKSKILFMFYILWFAIWIVFDFLHKGSSDSNLVISQIFLVGSVLACREDR